MYANNNIVINTGNVLNIIDINKKAGQQVSEELTECLQITLEEWKKNKNIKNNISTNEQVSIFRSNDDSHTKLAEEDRKNLKIGVKIFIQDQCAESLEKCLENVYKTLGIELIDNVILAYSFGESNSLPNGKDLDANDAEKKCDQTLSGLLNLWRILENYVKKERILQLGVSDLEEECFKRLHAGSEIRPSIIQINLSSCCVVPPGLQAFCKENDVQLLTHSDPQEIISTDVLRDVLSNDVKCLQWCLRYQVHIKCRGLLSLKGYMLGAILQ